MLKINLSIVVALMVLSSPWVIAATDYAPGFVWKRQLEWTPGTTPGTTLGNPDDDAKGNPVWGYEYVSGDGIGSSSPWYTQAGTPMVWDDEWWPLGPESGRWARAYLGAGSDNNINPPIGQYGMAHDLSLRKEAWKYISLMRWINPIDGASIVDIKGTLEIFWEGAGISPDVGVDIAIAGHRTDGQTMAIFTTSVSNPNPAITTAPYPSTLVPIALSGVRIEKGGAISFSFRAQSAPLATPKDVWVTMRDKLDITLVSTEAELVPDRRGSIGSFSIPMLAILVMAYWLRQRTLARSMRRLLS